MCWFRPSTLHAHHFWVGTGGGCRASHHPSVWHAGVIPARFPVRADRQVEEFTYYLFLNSFVEVSLVQEKMHIFNVHSWMSWNICTCCETITTIKVTDISIISQSFLESSLFCDKNTTWDLPSEQNFKGNMSIVDYRQKHLIFYSK